VLKAVFIDHRTTSANHPSANGLAERMVQSIKRALEKYAALEDGSASTWDDYLLHIALGYRVSVQASLGFSPYELMYGTKAILPTSIRPLVERPLELENPEQASEYLLQRASALQQHCAIAGGNLRIAQHRDQLRYLKMRSGYYNTTTTKFFPGDLIYVCRPNVPTNMQSAVRNGMYKIREVRDSGTQVVYGKCRTVIEVHSTNCAPCHLANVNTTIDPSLRTIPASHACHQCGSPDREEIMLICDGCLTWLPPGLHGAAPGCSAGRRPMVLHRLPAARHHPSHPGGTAPAGSARAGHGQAPAARPAAGYGGQGCRH
jgi:hypothetical protein